MKGQKKRMKKVVVKPKKKIIYRRKVSKALIVPEQDNKLAALCVEHEETNALISSYITGQNMNEQAYEFVSKRGFYNAGLTCKGAEACAKATPTKIKKPTWKGFQPMRVLDKSTGLPAYRIDTLIPGQILSIKVWMRNPAKPKIIVDGVCEFDPRDEFAQRSSETKAVRNATLKLIDPEKRIAYLGNLLLAKRAYEQSGGRYKIDEQLQFKINKPNEAVRTIEAGTKKEQTEKVMPKKAQIDNAVAWCAAQAKTIGLNFDSWKLELKQRYQKEHINEVPIEILREQGTIMMQKTTDVKRWNDDIARAIKKT